MIRLLSSILHHYELDHSDERCTEPNEEQDSTNLGGYLFIYIPMRNKKPGAEFGNPSKAT